MAINEYTKAVVKFNGTALGFNSISEAVSFVEQQLPTDEKAFATVTDAITGGVTTEDGTFQIFDTLSYEELYGDESE